MRLVATVAGVWRALLTAAVFLALFYGMTLVDSAWLRDWATLALGVE